jgi:monofunctional biosynthetic peptidoglycan transglycosylase
VLEEHRRQRLSPVLRIVWWLSRILLIAAAGSILVVLALRWLPPPTSSFMLQRHLEVASTQPRTLTTGYHWVPYEAIASELALAVIAAEDQRFPRHRGFDFVEIRNALEARSAGKPLRGASTISQQVAKNLFLWPGRSLWRKGLEAWFTLLIELLWSKQRILEVYLNIAQFGAATFGAEAAGRRFFDKSAARLSRHQAALLAAALPNPMLYQVEAPSVRMRSRQQWILQQMRQLGGISYLENL